MTADLRVYLQQSGWSPLFHTGESKLYCHLANEGESFFHQIASGELYLARSEENEGEALCLNCALRKGVVSNLRPGLRQKNPRSDLHLPSTSTDSIPLAPLPSE